MTALFRKSKKAEEKKEVEKPAVVESPKTEPSGGLTRTNLTVHIKRIYVSEKATRGKGLNQYVFEATSDANRPEIKKEVEKKYGVHVLRVNILNRKSKKVTVGRHEGRRPALRKAIVTLKEGESIPE